MRPSSCSHREPKAMTYIRPSRRKNAQLARTYVYGLAWLALRGRNRAASVWNGRAMALHQRVVSGIGTCYTYKAKVGVIMPVSPVEDKVSRSSTRGASGVCLCLHVCLGREQCLDYAAGL